MYRTLIIDDEPKLREVMKIKLRNFCPSITVVGEASDVEEAITKINELDPQLLLLDISMPGASGFDLLKEFDPIHFEVIFITGYDEYALDALRVSAVDYLLKPVKTEDLISAINKASHRIENRVNLSKYNILKDNLENVGNQQATIAIPDNDSYDFIKIGDIIRCEGWSKYTKIHSVNGKVTISSNNIGVFREMLSSYAFYACHKSHLINTKHIYKYNKDGTIVMSDKSEVPLARRRREEFVNSIMKTFTI